MAEPEARPKGPSRNRATVRHSAARMAAVQANYQLEMTQAATSAVIDEFLGHRLGQADVEASQGANANETLFKELVRGVEIQSEELRKFIEPLLPDGWNYDRLDVILRCILRLGTFELLHRVQVPAAVVIAEYMQLADAFFSGGEPGVVNGVLDRVAREVRPGELENRNDKPPRPAG